MSRPHATSRDLATLDDFAPGQSASFSKTIGEVELALFVALSGDVNPLHVDEEFARRTFFGGRIAHGLLSASLLSTVIGTLLPGTGAIYKGQSLRFLRPVRPGDTLTATVEVRDVDRARGDLHLATWIANQRGERVIEGEAVIGLLRQLRDA
ncbi:MAG TPA: MaoC family dehydratase [Thermoanaerobaculia bacterium]|nr:MaoC family dehydratase [Thermoanaerobaculia bacterium]